MEKVKIIIIYKFEKKWKKELWEKYKEKIKMILHGGGFWRKNRNNT